MYNKKTTFLALVAALTTLSLSASQTYDFTDPKGINNVRFSLDAPLESISGTANGISGSVSFDLENPAATTGSIALDATTLIVPNPVMQEHLHSENWLNTSVHGEIVFSAISFSNVERDGTIVTAELTGELTLNGHTHEVVTPVTFTHLADRVADRTGGRAEGDLLVLRASFSINRSDYGIMVGQATDTVAEEIVIDLALAGASYR